MLTTCIWDMYLNVWYARLVPKGKVPDVVPLGMLDDQVMLQVLT